MNQAGPSCGWKARRQAVHSVAPQTKASTTIETKNSCPQRILVADMSARCAPPRGAQRPYPDYRGRAHRRAEIGGSEGKVSLASKAPVDAAGTDDSAYLPAKFALKRRYPGYELEAQASVDHREAA